MRPEFLFAGNIVLDFASAAPSVVKSIRQRDLLNTWLRLYARQQTAPAIWEYQPARLEEELSDLIYYGGHVDADAASNHSERRYAHLAGLWTHRQGRSARRLYRAASRAPGDAGLS